MNKFYNFAEEKIRNEQHRMYGGTIGKRTKTNPTAHICQLARSLSLGCSPRLAAPRSLRTRSRSESTMAAEIERVVTNISCMTSRIANRYEYLPLKCYTMQKENLDLTTTHSKNYGIFNARIITSYGRRINSQFSCSICADKEIRFSHSQSLTRNYRQFATP